VLAAAPFLNKTCFALEQALNPSSHAATSQYLLQLSSQLCKEQQRDFQSSLVRLSLLQQLLKVPPPRSALAAPPAQPPVHNHRCTTTGAQPIGKHPTPTAEGTQPAQPEGDTAAPRRHFVDVGAPTTAHPLSNCPDTLQLPGWAVGL